MPPDLSVGRAYGPALGFQDAAEKELFDPLPDIKVLADGAEFHAKTAAETFTRGLSGDYYSPADRRVSALNGPFRTAVEVPLTTVGVFDHKGGRLVAPNTGEYIIVYSMLIHTKRHDQGVNITHSH